MLGKYSPAFLSIMMMLPGLVASEDASLTRKVTIYFIDRDRVVDEADIDAEYGEVLKLERYILDPGGRGYQPILFHEGRVTGPWITARTGKSIEFYRQEMDKEGQYVFVPDFSIDMPSGHENVLLVVDRSPGNGPVVHVVGLADLPGNEGLLLCNFSNDKLLFRLGKDNPVSVSAGEIRYLPADRSREGNTVSMVAARDGNGGMELVYNTIRRLRRNNLSVLVVTRPSENDYRFRHLQP